MSRIFEMLTAVVLDDRVVGVVDAALLAMGLTWTIASLAPALVRVRPRQEGRR
jgi:hypothetical protein